MNFNNPFSTLVQNELKEVEELIRLQVKDLHPDLMNALEIILSAGGKRIRPTIILLLGRLLNAPYEPILHTAASIELLHTATLVHDDLIDGSLLRRGKPTLNSRWSAPATVLTGDLMFACAARLADKIKSFEAMEVFAQTLIIMVNGEITQLLSSPCKVDREEYHQRIFAKTASLFESSTRIPAMISDLDVNQVEEMGLFGRELGMAFQVVDDILDYTGEQVELGKPVGSDLRQGLITLPAIIYIENHPEDPDAQTLLAGKCLEEEAVDRLINSILSSDAIERAYQEACLYIQSAIRRLRTRQECPERKVLEDIANYIVARKA